MVNQVETDIPAGRWYRGNLHMHSLWSDGCIFPELAAEQFKAAGYHFVAFTEHDCFQAGEKWIPTGGNTFTGQILQASGFLSAYQARFGTKWVESSLCDGEQCVRVKPLEEYRTLLEEPERFLILNGEEVTVTSRAGTHWMNVINAPAPNGGLRVDASPDVAMNRLADWAARMERESARPILVSLNHPNYLWNATAEDIVAATALQYFEIHTALNCTNSYGDGEHPGAERLWDIVLAHRMCRPGSQPVYGLATDDCHAYYKDCDLPSHEHGSSMPGRAWVMVRAPQLSPNNLVSAIKRGDFYASTGITLTTITRDSGRLRLQIEEQTGVQYVTQFIGTRRGADILGKPAGRAGRITRHYSTQVGEVLAEVSGPEPHYIFTGDELYVRAVVLSTAPHPNPAIPGDVMKAWIQPVVAGLSG